MDSAVKASNWVKFKTSPQKAQIIEVEEIDENQI
jgi:hypothetical protein